MYRRERLAVTYERAVSWEWASYSCFWTTHHFLFCSVPNSNRSVCSGTSKLVWVCWVHRQSSNAVAEVSLRQRPSVEICPVRIEQLVNLATVRGHQHLGARGNDQANMFSRETVTGVCHLYKPSTFIHLGIVKIVVHLRRNSEAEIKKQNPRTNTAVFNISPCG